MDKSIFEKIISHSHDLMNLRKNPILILNLSRIDRNGSLIISEKLLAKKYKEIDVILQTGGGDIDSAYVNIRLIRSCSQKVNFIIPLFAKSAGTLMCLGADNILMTNLSELGPLDTQIIEEQEGSPCYISALNQFKALERISIHTLETLDMTAKMLLSKSSMTIIEAIKSASEFAGVTCGKLYEKLDPMKIGEYARALEIGERYGIMILTKYMKWNSEQAYRTVSTLVTNYPHHGYIIDIDELKNLKLPASCVNNEEEKILKELRINFLNMDDNIIELIEPKVEQKNGSKNDAGDRNGDKKIRKNDTGKTK